jgi:type VI secretion system secreted protein VgrG
VKKAQTFVSEGRRDSLPATVTLDTAPALLRRHRLAPRRVPQRSRADHAERSPGKVTLRDLRSSESGASAGKRCHGSGAREAIGKSRRPELQALARRAARARPPQRSLHASRLRTSVDFSSTAWPLLACGHRGHARNTHGRSGRDRACPEQQHRIIARIEHGWTFDRLTLTPDHLRSPPGECRLIAWSGAHAPAHPRPSSCHHRHRRSGREIHTDGAAAHVRVSSSGTVKAPTTTGAATGIASEQPAAAQCSSRASAGRSSSPSRWGSGQTLWPAFQVEPTTPSNPPPYSLPANKTVTSLATVGSPADPTPVHLTCQGRQHLLWAARFGKTTASANGVLTRTSASNKGAKVSRGPRPGRSAACRGISVTNASIHDLGSQSAHVDRTQNIGIKGNSLVKVGSEKKSGDWRRLDRAGGTPGQITGALKKEGALFVARGASGRQGPASVQHLHKRPRRMRRRLRLRSNKAELAKPRFQHLSALARSMSRPRRRHRRGQRLEAPMGHDTKPVRPPQRGWLAAP